MKRILFFASGNGSNVENVIHYFKKRNDIEIAGVFCNNPEAKVLDKIKPQNIRSFVFTKAELNEGLVLKKVHELQPDLIVLAGFLWKMPEGIVQQYPNKIINIHPALLPKYGGKGMYGMNVHRAILENKEKETGITIHYVNEHYDEGEFIFQQTVNIEDCKTAEEIAGKVQALEHKHFPKVIENILIPNL
ncbi:phosphoribosylglycinamide formyltransferase [Flavobacterium sp. J49]|uniref:phosphoribosylglycinamide formyltransferase n=1 Tax=Flavobacterium sp. J49 TaxID=2718534 RepID=UPI0015930FE2|nr:phosphoribosylglycinamide formyltransferase [Flavobacterium sp. J49]MBF6641316.1 phosphoribosylglycinamide formyltransferase [Flavobacterium sp. J49]NIC02563.1 phosphoribosylglycinamide formyltransferase [Flavobacterium sp. J49]